MEKPVERLVERPVGDGVEDDARSGAVSGMEPWEMGGMEPWRLVARERIRDTVAAYTHAGDRGRIELLAETFAGDGVLEIHGRTPAAGRAAIVEMLSAVVAEGASSRAGHRPRYVRHFVANLAFDELTPHHALTSAYFLVMTEHGPDHWGRYRDRFVPVGDRWLISRRLVRVDDDRRPSAG